jgi:hypothetical protein
MEELYYYPVTLDFTEKRNDLMRKQSAVVAGIVALAVTGLVAAPSANARGPQFSLDVEAFCGDPTAVRLDADGNVIEVFNQNVAVELTDVSDDNGPADPQIGNLNVSCTAAVKIGRGKPNQVEFGSIDIPDPGFGVIDATCPLGSLPVGATEWKATATASGGDLRRPVSDTCEEVPVQ